MLEFLLGVAVFATFNGILSVSLNLQAGVSGLLNFGLIAFFGIGAYATGIASSHGASWLLGLVAGLILASLAGAAIGAVGRRLAAEYWAIATLAFAELLRLVALNQEGLTGGGQGISGIEDLFPSLSGTGRDLAWLVVGGAALGLSYLISRRLTESQFGRVLRLLREREPLAASLGHDVIAAKIKVLAIAGPMAALAGFLYTQYSTFIGPEQLVPFSTFLIFTMVVAGGLGNVRGVILGAFVVELIYDLTRFLHDLISISPAHAGGLRVLIVGLILLGFLLWRPEGILPEKLRKLHAPS